MLPSRKILETDDVLVVPNFLDFIDEIEAYVRAHSFVRADGALYGGRTMPIAPEHDHRIRELVNDFLGVAGLKGHGRLRLTSPRDEGTDKTFIHLDHDCVVVIVYLTTGADETSFYRHKNIGRKKMAPKSSVKDYLVDDVIMSHHSQRYEEWERWKSVTAERNTALIFDGHLFHSGPPQYSGIEGRITIDYFFSREQLLQLI
jgi:hypothetical protein